MKSSVTLPRVIEQTNIPNVAALAQHLYQRAYQFFPEFCPESVDVKLVGVWKRPASTLYRFDIGTLAQRRFVLVKVPSLRDTFGQNRDRLPDQAQGRPRLVPLTESEEKFKLEAVALSSMYEYFAALGDDRFGAIRIFDSLPNYHAIIMEEVRDRSLRELFMQGSRLHRVRPQCSLGIVFYNAGAWLRAYHALPKHIYVETRHSQRVDFVDSIVNLANFLGNKLRAKPFFEHVARTTIALALSRFPESFPLGLGHGDFAPRNILVGLNNRVTVLDTLAKWRVPIYEDIAYFLNALNTMRPYIYSQGLMFNSSYIAQSEQAFLQGYFEQESIPLQAIRLFEIQWLLDKWASYVFRSEQTHSRGLVKRWQGVLQNRFFYNRVNYLLRAISEP